MGDTVTFDPDAMEQVAADLDLHAAGLHRVSDRLAAALAAYEASGTEFVVPTGDHGERVAAHGDLVHGLGTSVLQLAGAAREADRQGLDLAEVRDALAPVGTASALQGRHDAVVRLLRASVHEGRDLRAAASQLRLDHVYGTRPMPDIEAIRRRVAGGAAMRRQQVRGLQLQRYRELKRTRRSLQGTRAAARAGLRTNAPVTRIGGRVDAVMRTTRTGAVLRGGSRVLGVAGVGIGLVDTVDAVASGDAEGAVVSGLSTAGGVLMMSGNPVTMGAGAVLVAGVMVYENWDAISDVAGDAVDAVGDGLAAAGEGLADLGGSIVDGAGDLVGGLF